jgi:hypothetical protein
MSDWRARQQNRRQPERDEPESLPLHIEPPRPIVPGGRKPSSETEETENEGQRGVIIIDMV